MQTPASLTGTNWRITEIGGEAIAAADEERPARLRLDDSGARFAASAGCNNMMGAYDLAGVALTLGHAATTMMMCDDELMRRERALIDAFAATRAYAIAANDLSLLDAEGVVLVRAEAVSGKAEA